MAGVNDAIGAATRLGEIGFVEFTTKLVSDVFDTLVASNLRQQQAFIELLQATSKSLTAYVNETKDDIGPGEIMQVLTAIAPRNTDTPATSDSPTAVTSGGKLSADEAAAINTALTITDPDTNAVSNDKAAKAGALDDKAIDTLREAVAQRVAANKYTLLKEMVKLGMLRLSSPTAPSRAGSTSTPTDRTSCATTRAATRASSSSSRPTRRPAASCRRGSRRRRARPTPRSTSARATPRAARARGSTSRSPAA